MWDKKLHKIMAEAGYKTIESSPGYFYNRSEDAECTVYVDDFVLSAHPERDDKVWAKLSKAIDFKDPPELINRHLGVYHHIDQPKGAKVTRMIREGKAYLEAAAKRYCEEIGVQKLEYVESPFIEDKLDEAHLQPGKQASTASSHLMSLLYDARLCRGDLITTTSFLSRRVSKWTLNDDKRLRRLMAYVFHHADLCLNHELSTDDRSEAVLDYYPDAELGGDYTTTKATGGFWLEVVSPCGTRKWPITWCTKKAGHSSTATADSEVWSLVGAQEVGLKKEVIPLLQQMEVSLNRLVLLRGREDNTQCIAAIRKGYSPGLRHLQRHCRLSLGFTNEVFYCDLTDRDAPFYYSELVYCESAKQKGDWMTKELPPIKFKAALELAGYSKPPE